MTTIQTIQTQSERPPVALSHPLGQSMGMNKPICIQADPDCPSAGHESKPTRTKRLSPEEKDTIYGRLRQAVGRIESCYRVAGPDIDLLKTADESYRDIAARLGIPKSTVADWHVVWKAFPTAESLVVDEKPGSFFVALNSAKVRTRVRRSGKDVPIREIYEKAVRENLTGRDLRSFFEKRNQQEELNRLKALVPTLPKEGWLNRCHHADCRMIAEKLPDRSIDFANVDNPYFGYRDEQGNGGLRQEAYGAHVLKNCANRTEREAKAVVLDLIPILARKLKPSGVLLYWANGIRSDDWAIVKAFEEFGLQDWRAGVWLKRAIAPMDMSTAQSTSCERYLVRTPVGNVPKNWDYKASRNNVLEDFPCVVDITPATKAAHGVYHIMEKPVSLTEHFLRIYCPPGSVAFDAFGCSGSSCIAALNLGHRFVYCELDEENYNYGAGRIAEALAQTAAA